MMDSMSLDALQARLGYRFAQPALLETALTHPSYGDDHHVPHYQRLEFLGDAVFELAASHMLYEGFAQMGEGQLTRLRGLHEGTEGQGPRREEGDQLYGSRRHGLRADRSRDHF